MGEKAEWLNAPTHDGIWWGNFGGASNCYMVVGQRCYLHGESHTNATPIDRMPTGWWITVVPAPPAPSKPLPKSRTVVLTARIINDGRRGYECQFHLDGKEASWFDEMNKESAIELAREWGIEPEVIDD